MQEYQEKLVQRVNELFFDLNSDDYHCNHPEIIEQERSRWEKVAKLFVYSSNAKTILDIGTGTGFVPLAIAKYLKGDDLFVCSDISKSILTKAEQNIQKQKFDCRFKYVKLDTSVPYQLPFETGSIDIITINSVLHHFKDFDTLLREVNRVLKKAGLLFIGHEPNSYFFKHRFLWYNFVILEKILDFRGNLRKILRLLRIENTLRAFYYFVRSDRKEFALKQKNDIRRLNDVLIKEKLIEQPLLPNEICRIVDVNSRVGFKPDSLLEGYELLSLETYNHVFWVSIKHNNSSIITRYSDFLKRKFPRHGATFFVILKKQHEPAEHREA